MKKTNIGNANITLIGEGIVVFEADPDIVVDKEATQNFYQAINKQVSGNYSIIIHRKNRYQLLRIEAFNVINSQEKLDAMAIVAPQEVKKKMAEMEAPLCKKPFATFVNLDDAVAWIKERLKN